MLELSPEKVAELKEQVITDDENAIREEFKFRKNAEKYPIMYVERGSDGLVVRTLITYVALIQRSAVTNMGSLLVQVQDGRWTRICSAYLNEMQGMEDSAPATSEEVFDGDSLFD